MDVNSVVKLALDYRKDSVKGNYSKDDSSEVIRKALIEANGGKDKIDLKSLRSGHNELFSIIEILVDKTSSEGLEGNEFFNNMVDSRNISEGDEPSFVVQPNSTLVVSDISRGSQSLRRQRIGEVTKISLTPVARGIKVYDELSRILAGNADINLLIDTVSESVMKAKLDDIFAAWNGITSSTLGSDYYPVAGSYNEDALLDLVDHVSAANDGVGCMLISTLRGARKLGTSIVSEAARNDFYKQGYTANWNGVPVQITPQRHIVGTNTFMFDDNKIYVIPKNMDKPIKQVNSGESMMIMGNPTDNADLTQEFTLLSAWQTAIVTGNKFGVYELES